MTDLNKLFSPLFLSDTEIRKVIELIFFSYREFTSGPDKILNKINFGRAHHRVIYFVGKKNQITIRDLLEILQITKQSLSRVLNQLVKENYIILSIGKDKRTKNVLYFFSLKYVSSNPLSLSSSSIIKIFCGINFIY